MHARDRHCLRYCHVNSEPGDHGRAVLKRRKSRGSSLLLCCWLNSSHLVPDEESPLAFLLIGVCSQAMPTRTEMLSDRAMSREEALSMAR